MRIKLFSLSLLAASVLLMSTPLLGQELEPALQQEETQSVPAEATAAEVQVTQEGETSLESVEPSGEPAESAPTSIEESRELPQTASPLALMALLGAAGVGSASIVRVIRRR